MKVPWSTRLLMVLAWLLDVWERSPRHRRYDRD